MRVAFLGKGGSGKTSMSALFAHWALRNKANLMTIDADVNAHLGKTLGVTKNTAALSQHYAEIYQILEGNNEFFNSIGIVPEFGSIPPTKRSHFVNLDQSDPMLSRFGAWSDNHVHMVVGNYDHVEIGGACYHFKLNALELFLHHLREPRDCYVVADTTAGIDNVGTSLFMAYDLNIFCVEPTLKSVAVFKDFMNVTKDRGLVVKAVGNKIENEADKLFLQEHIPAELLLGFVGWEPSFAAFEQDQDFCMQDYVVKYSELCAAISSEANKASRDWPTYQEILEAIYLKECTSWWNGYYGTDLTRLLTHPNLEPQMAA